MPMPPPRKCGRTTIFKKLAGGAPILKLPTPEEVDDNGTEMEVEPPIPSLPEKALKTVLNSLSTPELTKCRLVSKEWNRSAVEILNHRMVITIQSVADMIKYCEAFQSSKDDLSLALRSIDFRAALFEKVVEKLLGGNAALVELTTAVQELAKIAGDQVRELELWLSIEQTDWLKLPDFLTTRKEIYAVIWQILFVHFKNAEKMKLSISSDQNMELHQNDWDVEWDVEECERTRLVLSKLRDLTIWHSFDVKISKWADRPKLRAFFDLSKCLLKAAVNLKRLNCDSEYSHEVDEELDLISPSLEVLHIDGKFAAERFLFSDMQNLMKSRKRFINLESLRVEGVGLVDHNKEAHRKFLKCFADVLTELKFNVAFESKAKFTFPPKDVVLEILEKLQVSEYNGSILWENMPNLKELEFKKSVVVRSNKIYSSTLPSNWSLTKFSYGMNQWYEESQLELEAIYPTLMSPSIPLWFSSLSVLQLHLRGDLLNDGAVITRVFERCSQLQFFKLTTEVGFPQCDESFDLDECLTGISQQALDIFRKRCPVSKGKASSEQIMKMNKVAMATSTSLNIGNLSELQGLHLEGSFSDAAVLFGIIRCKKLKKLHLKSPKEYGLTVDAGLIAKSALPDLMECYVQYFFF